MLKTIVLCASLVFSQVVLAQSLIDEKASKKTNNLYQNLKNSAQKNVLIGHQDDMAYGVKWQAKKGRSDVRETVGSYPAMHGWTIDFSENVYNNDSIKYDQMKIWMREVYSRGGINAWLPNKAALKLNMVWALCLLMARAYLKAMSMRICGGT